MWILRVTTKVISKKWEIFHYQITLTSVTSINLNITSSFTPNVTCETTRHLARCDNEKKKSEIQITIATRNCSKTVAREEARTLRVELSDWHLRFKKKKKKSFVIGWKLLLKSEILADSRYVCEVPASRESSFSFFLRNVRHWVTPGVEWPFPRGLPFVVFCFALFVKVPIGATWFFEKQNINPFTAIPSL